MGISRRSTFLHALASSSGVSVGGVSESIESESLFERCSMYVIDGLSSFAAMGKRKLKRKGREGEGGEGRGVSEGSPDGRSSLRTVPAMVRCSM